MIEEVKNAEQANKMVNEVFERNTQFYDLNFCLRSLEKQFGKSDHKLYASRKNNHVEGLYFLLVLKEEMYIELLWAVGSQKEELIEFMNDLKKIFPSYQLDAVFPYANKWMMEGFQLANAHFETPQYFMVYKTPNSYLNQEQVVPYQDMYQEWYLNHHIDSIYWNGQRVLEARDQFEILIALEDGKPVGYLDLCMKGDMLEPYHIYVEDSYRQKGYGHALLKQALVVAGEKPVCLFVDVDNTAALSLYKDCGFEIQENSTSITVSIPNL